MRRNCTNSSKFKENTLLLTVKLDITLTPSFHTTKTSVNTAQPWHKNAKKNRHGSCSAVQVFLLCAQVPHMASYNNKVTVAIGTR